MASDRTLKLSIEASDFKSTLKDLVASIDRLSKKVDEMGQRTTQSMSRSASNVKKVNKVLTEQERIYKELKVEYNKLSSRRASLDNKQLKRLSDITMQMKRMRVEMNKVGTQGAAAVNKVTAAQTRLNSRVSVGRQLFLRLKSVMLTVFGAYAVIQGIRNTINTIKDFELGIARVRAITGATKEEIELLANSAKILAETGIFNPTEITELQVKLAKLGFTLKEIANATEGIIDLATATGEDLALAAETVASVIRGLGLDASETGRIVDVLGKAFTSSALDINKFRESAKFILPLARQLGWTLEEVVAVLGKLADSLISGSLAGTGMRTLFIELADTTSKLSVLMGEGVRTFDEFVDGLKGLRKEGVSTAAILDAVPKRAVTLTAVLLAQGEALRIYKDEVVDASGAIKEMAEIQMATLTNQLERMGAAWSSLILSMQDSGGVLTDVAGGFNTLLNLWSFQLNPASRGLHAASKTIKLYRESIDDLTADQKLQRTSEIILHLAESIRELDAITRKSDNTIAFLADLREQVKLLLELQGDIGFESELDKLTKTLIKRTAELEKSGIKSAEAFEIAFREASQKILTEIEGITDTLIEQREEISEVIGISVEFDANAKAELEKQAGAEIERLNKLQAALGEYFLERLKTFEGEDALDKATIKKMQNRNKELELANAELIKDDQIREETILEINKRYKILGRELDLKYDDLTVRDRETIHKLIKTDEEIFQQELLAIKEEFHEEDLSDAEEAANEQIELQRKIFAVRLQEMKNAGASEQQIQRETLKHQAQVLKAQIAIAKAFGATTVAIQQMEADLALINAQIAGITDDEVVEKVEDNTMKIAQAYERLAIEILDSLSTIADAQVDELDRLVDNLDTRIAETQRALEVEATLFAAGYANNVTLKKKELDELKKQRQKALQDQEAAVKRQRALEAVTQAINLGSAVAKVINLFAPLGPLGIVISASTIAGFLTLFFTTMNRIKSSTAFGEGGKVNGASHAQGGVAAELEGGEYVIKKSQTNKYSSLIQAINDDTLPTLNQNVLNSASFEKRGDVIVSTKEWGEIRDLLADNLKGKNVEFHGNKKIITSGIKKRIINV